MLQEMAERRPCRVVELLVEQGDLESQLEVALALQVQELVLLPELVAFLLA